MRIELRDGQWADLRERINHADDKELKRAVQRGKDEPMEKWDVETIIVRKFLRDWHVSDPDGNPIPVTDADAVERAPDDIVEALALEAGKAWTGATVPNASTPPSSADS